MLNSYRNILRGTVLIGGSTAITMGLAVVRTKVLAVLGGAESIGIVGLFTSIIGVASTLTGVGLGTAGVRELTTARAEEKVLIRNSLRAYSFMLASLGALALVLSSDLIASRLFDGRIDSSAVAALSIGLVATIFATTLMVELRSQHRVKEIASANIVASVIATVALVGYLLWHGPYKEVVFVLAPLVTTVVVLAILSGQKTQTATATTFNVKDLVSRWADFFRVGAPLMLASLISAGSDLAIRIVIEQRSGLSVLGLLTAVLLLSEKSLGMVLKAMGVDYFPRLSQSISDPSRTSSIVNRQIRIVLAIGMPIVVVMFAFAPTILVLLYSREFAAATEVLRWFVLGDYLKMIVWPVGQVIIARGYSMTYFIKETVISLGYLAIIFFVRETDLTVVGIAYLVTRILNLAAVYFIAWKLCAYRPSTYALVHAVVFALIAVAVLASEFLKPEFALYVAAALVLATALHSMYDLRSLLRRDKSETPA